MRSRFAFLIPFLVFFISFYSIADAGKRPSAPSNLSATAISPSQINLSWTDNSTNEDGFKIEGASSSGGPWSQIATVGANVTTYSNTGLNASTAYYYRVCAYNASGNSAYSNTASTTTLPTLPDAPSNLSASAVSSSQINLSWTDNSTNEDGFKIERASSAGGPWSQIATVGTNLTAYSDTGLNASTTYYYRVCAYNAAGNSAYSNTASAATVPSVIALTIDSPLEGATIYGPNVVVEGTVTNGGGHETGVTVNGIVAGTYGNQFTANRVPLAEGTNVIAATATDSYGHMAIVSVTVNAVTTGNYIRLTSDTELGIGPLEATLRIDGSFSIDNSTISVTGPTQPEFLSSSADEYKIRMTTEGVYYFTASVTGPDGNQYQDTVVITVMSRTQMDNLLKSKWDEMKTALMARDIQSAASYFADWAKERYSGIFTALGDTLPQVAQAMQDIEMIYLLDGVAKYRIRRIEAEGEITYYIYFVKDANGLWKIQQF